MHAKHEARGFLHVGMLTDVSNEHRPNAYDEDSHIASISFILHASSDFKTSKMNFANNRLTNL